MRSPRPFRHASLFPDSRLLAVLQFVVCHRPARKLLTATYQLLLHEEEEGLQQRVPRSVVTLTARTSSRRSSTLSWSLGVRRSSVSLVLVRVFICILRRSDGSLVVCQDTDSHYSLIRMHRPGWPVIQGSARCRHL